MTLAVSRLGGSQTAPTFLSRTRALILEFLEVPAIKFCRIPVGIRFFIKGNRLENHKAEDRLTLRGIRILPRIGTTPEERSAPQDCRADIVIHGSFAKAAAEDSLDQSIDYCQILTKVQETVAEREYVLLETLAYAIRQSVLDTFHVAGVEVRVRKRPEILLNQLDFVEVSI